MARTRIENVPFNRVAVTLFIICITAGAIATASISHPAPVIAGALIGIYFLFAIKVAQQWEKAALLRLGKYAGLRGPGWFHMIPVIETVSQFVDQRIRLASVTAESTLTRDTVPVNVDAVVFWMIWRRVASGPTVESAPTPQ